MKKLLTERFQELAGIKPLYIEKADPNKLDHERFPKKLGDVDKEKATQYVDAGDFDGEKEDDVIPVNNASFPTSALKPSQSSMDIEKALAFAIHMMSKTAPFANGPGGDLDAFISNDNFIMDGHHRWIATAMVNPGAKIGGFQVEFPGDELIAVLNALTKGEFNKPGKEASGGFEQFQEGPIRAQLEKYLDSGAWSMKPEQVQSAIEQFTGIEGEGAKDAAVNKFVSNLSTVSFELPPGAPARPDMPVISAKAGHVKQALDKMTTGDIDVNPPYAPARKTDAKAALAGLAESQLRKLIRESIKELVETKIQLNEETFDECLRDYVNSSITFWMNYHTNPITGEIDMEGLFTDMILGAVEHCEHILDGDGRVRIDNPKQHLHTLGERENLSNDVSAIIQDVFMKCADECRAEVFETCMKSCTKRRL